jgi:putative oxidoreductase
MKQLLFFSDGSWSGLILRITIALTMFPHGAQKLLGLFGGYGFKPTIDYFTNTMKLPWIIAILIVVIEFICPIALLIGVGSRLCSLLVIIIMTGAIITTNYKFGFFMNWFGTQTGEGFEYHLIVIGICIALLFTGSGKYSIDGIIHSLRPL